MVVILNLNMTIDKTVVIYDFEKGYSFRKNPDVVVAGGKGVNVARALKNFYSNYCVIGFICGYTGKLIKELGSNEKINLNLIYQKEGESRTCLTIIDRNGVNTDINEEGPIINSKSIDTFLDVFSKKISFNILCLSGRGIRGVRKGFYNNILDIAIRKGADIFCDLSGSALKEVVYKTHTLKINANEFYEISGLSNTVENVKKFYDRCKRYNLKNLIITDGQAKIVAVINGDVYSVFPPKIKNVSSVGAGDSFMAGLIYSFIMKYDCENMLKTATSFAISDCLTLGAGMINKSDIKKYFNKIKVVRS